MNYTQNGVTVKALPWTQTNEAVIVLRLNQLNWPYTYTDFYHVTIAGCAVQECDVIVEFPDHELKVYSPAAFYNQFTAA